MHADPLFEDKTLPMLVSQSRRGASQVEDFIDWVEMNQETLDDWVHRAGAVLIRGFAINDAELFYRVCSAIRGDLLDDIGAEVPRNPVRDRVFSASDYPGNIEVPLHNELCYSGISPERVFLGCLQPSGGGETRLADGRQMHAAMRKEVRRRFEDLGVIYHRHLPERDNANATLGCWQDVFSSEDRDDVELRLVEWEMKYEWTETGLHIDSWHPGVLQHLATGELCWHNQADRWHREMPGSINAIAGIAGRENKAAGTDDPGCHVTYGDGSDITLADLLHVREVARACEVTFAMEKGDLLIIDNVSALNGRNPFTGKRNIVVSMA